TTRDYSSNFSSCSWKNQKRYNVNADTAAGAVASALNAKQLVFVTDVPGILQDDMLLEKVSVKDIEQLVADGKIYGGMIPKLKAATKGVQGIIQEVMIVDETYSKMKAENTLMGATITYTSATFNVEMERRSV